MSDLLKEDLGGLIQEDGTAVLTESDVQLDFIAQSNRTDQISTKTWSHTVGDELDRVLIVAVTYNANNDTEVINSVTYGGTALTGLSVVNAGSGGVNRRVQLWYLNDPAVGTADVQVAFSANTVTFLGTSISVCGAADIDTSKVFSASTTSANTLTQTPTTTAGSLVLSAASIRDSGAASGPALLWNLITSGTNNRSMGGAIATTGTSTPVTYTWTTGGNGVMQGIEILPAAPGMVRTVTQGAVARVIRTPKMATLVDDFSDSTQNNGLGRWQKPGGGALPAEIQITGGRLVAQAATTYAAQTESTQAYDIRDSYAYVQIVGRPTQGGAGSTEMYFGVRIDETNGFYLILTGSGTVVYQQVAAGSVVNSGFATFDPVAMAWLRIRESAGTIFFEAASSSAFTSPTVLGSIANALDLSSMRAFFMAGDYGSTASPGTAIWDNFNTAPTAQSTKDQSAVARIAQTRSASQGASSRISQTRTRTQTGVARVASTLTRTQSANARITAVRTAVQSASARIAVRRTRTQTAAARIASVRTAPQSALARISTARTRTQGSAARISATRSSAQSAVARISQTYQATQSAAARILVSVAGEAVQQATARLSWVNQFTDDFSTEDHTKWVAGYPYVHDEADPWPEHTTATGVLDFDISDGDLGFTQDLQSLRVGDWRGQSMFIQVLELPTGQFDSAVISINTLDQGAGYYLEIRPSEGVLYSYYFDAVDYDESTISATLTTPFWVRIRHDIPTDQVTIEVGDLTTDTWTVAGQYPGVDDLTLMGPQLAAYSSGLTDPGPNHLVLDNYRVTPSVQVAVDQPATARIAVTSTATQGGTSRIAVTRTAFQSAVARISLNRTTTQSAVSRIAQTLTAAQSAAARVAIRRTRTQLSAGRLALTRSRSQISSGQIAVVRSAAQSAVARLSASRSATQSAAARISQRRSTTQTGAARIASRPTSPQSAIARIATDRTRTQSATARIATGLSLDQPAVARISITGSSGQSAAALIAQSYTSTQSAIARIATAQSTDQGATATIAQTRTTTQTGTARVVFQDPGGTWDPDVTEPTQWQVQTRENTGFAATIEVANPVQVTLTEITVDDDVSTDTITTEVDNP